jgi:copper/silver efflux system protein
MVVRTEDTRPNSWVYVDIRNIDVGTYVKNAQLAVEEKVKLPVGYNLIWSGEFEYMQHARKRLLLIIPLTLFIIFVIIYLNTRSIIKTAIVFLAIPFSLVGAIWLLYLLGYNLSIAVWVGMIALAGLDAETGVVMLLYLDHAYHDLREKGRMRNRSDLREAIDFGAVRRVRPKIMTATVIIAGLVPIMWSHGTGADVMKRIVAPMIGGVATSVIMELAVYPVIYYFWKSKGLAKENTTGRHYQTG